jgi:hypothetical protein
VTKRDAPGAGETGYSGDSERPMDATGPGEASDETPRTEGRAASLLDRWQAHHDEQQSDVDDETADATSGTDVAARDASGSAPDGDGDGDAAADLPDTPDTPDLPDLPDQPAPSVADHLPEPEAEPAPAPAVPRISDLAAARARRAGPVEPEPEAVEPTPLHPAAARSAPEPEPSPEPVAESEPVAETPEPSPQRSVPRAGPDSGEIPVLGPDAEAPAPSPAALAKPSSGVRRPKHAAPRPAPLSSDRATDSVSASREVMDALAAGRDSGPAPEKAAPKHLARMRLTGREEGEPDAVPATSTSKATTGRRRRRERAPGPQSAAGVRSGPEVGPSLNVEFEPKIAARRVIGLLLLVALIVTAGAAYLAYDDPRPLTLGAAGTLLAVTLVLYAVRAGSTPTLVAIRSGQLEVTRGKTHEVFDLTSRFTRIEVVGKPGGRGWKVLFGRFGRDPLVINSSIVDPEKFTAELERYRWRRP